MTKVYIPETENKHELGRCYYHFLYGLVFPIIYLERRGIIGEETVYIAQCGKLDKFQGILDELRQHNVVDIQVMKTSVNNEYIGLPSMEHYYTSYGFPLRRINTDLLALHNVKSRLVFLMADVQDFFYDILLLERADDHRVIPNMPEIDVALMKAGNIVKRATLGRLSLKDQINLFQKSRTVICQHGADLSNMPFLLGNTVIEIAPKAFIDSGLDYYGELAKQCDMNRIRIEQDFINSKVDPSLILEVL